MLTLSKTEHENMVASAEATLVVKCQAALCDLKKGRDLSEVYLPLCVANSNLRSIRHFRTGKFDPAQYYNNVTPLQISGMYSNVNTLMK